MHCRVVRIAGLYVLQGHIHCRVVCIVGSYALQGRTHCRVVCIVELYALQSCRNALIRYIKVVLVDSINVLGSVTS